MRKYVVCGAEALSFDAAEPPQWCELSGPVICQPAQNDQELLQSPSFMASLLLVSRILEEPVLRDPLCELLREGDRLHRAPSTKEERDKIEAVCAHWAGAPVYKMTDDEKLYGQFRVRSPNEIFISKWLVESADAASAEQQSVFCLLIAVTIIHEGWGHRLIRWIGAMAGDRKSRTPPGVLPKHAGNFVEVAIFGGMYRHIGAGTASSPARLVWTRNVLWDDDSVVNASFTRRLFTNAFWDGIDSSSERLLFPGPEDIEPEARPHDDVQRALSWLEDDEEDIVEPATDTASAPAATSAAPSPREHQKPFQPAPDVDFS